MKKASHNESVHPFDNIEGIVCTKMKQLTGPFGKEGKAPCTKQAQFTDGKNVHLCRDHARKGRFVARIGDAGEILTRFNTEQELRDNIHLFPECRMQKLTSSRRRDIY